MSAKMIKDGNEYKLGSIPQNVIDDVTFLKNACTYSTTEHKVGKWIDGSDLYEKTVSIGALPNNTYQGYSLGIPDGSVVRECVGYATTGNYFQPLEVYSNGNYTHWYIDTRSIFVFTNSDMSDWIGRVTVRYTKV